ncbi:chymotrypsinogen 2-like [Daktulosphaira vitifoliae]|uniref:chymotrypsinogen 2-like n=1 Tax=Daktulosphaira vitifoliae TaxID=58002 RepID=UPI0021AA604C|nr:chymotrypsinogen 2-like [Daktulosphaira vitifoliae]
MKHSLILVLRFLLALSYTVAFQKYAYREETTDDAVILEAIPLEKVPKIVSQNVQTKSNVAQYRSKRQSQWPLASGPCLTGRGSLGKCVSLRSCYPYIKLPNMPYWETSVIGMYDTCTYIDQNHKQNFGVCCTHPGALRPAFPPNYYNEDMLYPFWGVPPNWPPSFPQQPPPQSPISPPVTNWPSQPPLQIEPEEVPNTNPAPSPPSNNQPNTTNTNNISGNESYECGLKHILGDDQDQERIVGGQNADPGEWPWIAAIFNSGRHFCGGSLIDDSHILTAAHCVAYMNSWDVARLTAHLGDYNIKSKSEIKHLERKIKRVVRHKGFDQRTLYNDIAILTLDKPVKFSKEVHPICLPQSKSSYIGKQATVIGWGSLKESGPQPAILQEVNVPVWTNQECRQRYGEAAPGGIVEHFLCAGKATKDSCSGDSGGPLMLNDQKWTQVGIVSWGIGCGKGQYPGVYTRVTNFMPWIRKNLKN